MAEAVATGSLPERLLGRIVQVRREEIGALVWSFAYFLCLLAAYYVLRPIRDEMAVQFGADRLQWLFTGTFLTMVAMIPAFGWLASRLDVDRLLPVVYGFFALNLVGFWFALDAGVPSDVLAPVFFVWVSVFNLFVVSVFWSFMADCHDTDAARRLFGFIAAGGSLGAVAGPALTALLVPRLGIAAMLLVSAALLGAAIGCIGMLLAIRRRRTGTVRRYLSDRESQDDARPSIWVGIARIARSPYLLGISVFLICHTLLATMLYFYQTRLVPQVLSAPEARTQLFAAIDLAVNLITLFTQFLLTGRLMARFGVTAMLAALPVFSVAAFLTLGVATLLPVLVVVGVLRRAGEYAIAKPARETLFTIVPPTEKYQAKNAIDTVVYRGGDMTSGWIVAGLTGVGLSLSGMAFAAVPVALVWLATALFLGRRHEAMRRLPQPAEIRQ